MRRGFIMITLIWMTACVVQKSYAIDSSVVKAELLNKLARTQEGDTTRLDILDQLIRTSDNTQVELYYVNKLMKEAEELNSDWWRAQAYLAHMYLAYNSFQSKDVYRWMERLEPLARKEKFHNTLFLGKRCVTDMLMIVDGEYERAEREANKTLKEARKLNNKVGISASVNSLSNVYQLTYRWKEAARILEDNYSVMLEAGNNLPLEAANSLISVYKTLDDRPNWLRWVKLQEAYIDDVIKMKLDSENQMRIWKLMNYIHYLDYYTIVDNRPAAEKYLRLSKEYFMKGYNSVVAYYHPVRYAYYFQTEQYEKALEEVAALIEINKNTSPLVYNKNYFMKAEILRKLGRFDEALVIYKQAFVIKDSLRVENINMQVEQLKNDYNANTLQLERERIDRNTQIVLLVLVIIVFIILICYMINTYRVRNSLQKSESEMRKMSEEMEQANVAKEHFLSSISSVINVPLNETVKEAMLLATEKQLGEEEKREIAAGLNKTSAELMKLINNILDLSRLEAGMMKFQISEIEMVMLTQSLIDGVNMQAADKVFAVLPKQSFMMKIDATRYSQVINNLLQETDPSVSDSQMLFAMNITGKGEMFVSVKGTILAKPQRTQEQIVVNEVNRMIIEYFGGSYEIHSDDPEPFICFTL